MSKRQGKRRDREVLALEDVTEAEIAALAAVRTPESAKAFDAEVRTAGPSFEVGSAVSSKERP